MHISPTAMFLAPLLFSFALTGGSYAPASNPCDIAGWSGNCISGNNTGSSITVGGTHTTPGGHGGGSRPPASNHDGGAGGNSHTGGGSHAGNAGGSQVGGGSSGPDYGSQGVNPTPVDCLSPTTACKAVSKPRPTAPPPPAGAPDTPISYPAVTVSDLASFSPHAAVTATEPEGVGIVGMPVNVYATASAHTLRGLVLGYPVQVRFSPDHFVFTYGDGATARSATGGASRSALRVPQFSPTPTSHVYRDRGVYRPTVTVAYSASVAFPDGVWHPVAGFVTATTATSPVHVYEARTALVGYTCIDIPTAPGC